MNVTQHMISFVDSFCVHSIRSENNDINWAGKRTTKIVLVNFIYTYKQEIGYNQICNNMIYRGW